MEEDWDNKSKYNSIHSNEALFCIESHWIFCINIPISICCSDEKRTIVWNILWILFFFCFYSCSLYNNIISFRQIDSMGNSFDLLHHITLSVSRSRFSYAHTKFNIGNFSFFFRRKARADLMYNNVSEDKNRYRCEDWWFPGNEIQVKNNQGGLVC